MPSQMKTLAVAAAVAGVALAGGADWESYPTTTPAPDCNPWYEPYVCDDEHGGEYTTTYTLYSKGCPGYTSWAVWPPAPAETWSSYDPPSTWSEYDPPKSTWEVYDPKPTTWSEYDPPTTTWATWAPAPTGWKGAPPKAPQWPDNCGPQPYGWDQWEGYPGGPAPPGWFPWDYSKGPMPADWEEWIVIVVVPSWPGQKGPAPAGWDEWKFNPSAPAPPPGWYEWSGPGEPANWNDWKNAIPVYSQPQWSNVVTITFTEIFVVPCSTGWETSTTTLYYGHCGCTETPKPTAPAWTVITTTCPESWGVGVTVTYSTPVAEASTTWNTWATPEATTVNTWNTWATPVAASATTWSTWATPVAASSAVWSGVATWHGAASSIAVSKIMVAAVGAIAGLALFL